MTDLNKCPKCGGHADNGHDRCVPPNAYVCSCCDDKSWLDTKPNLKYIEEIGEPERMFELAYEAIERRREKYRLEVVIEKLFKALFSISHCPQNIPAKECRNITCRQCWSKHMEYEL